MSRLLVNKQTKIISVILTIFLVFSIYVFFEFKTIKSESDTYLKKSLILKYDTYLEMLKKSNQINSLVIENRDYFDSLEFVEEYKKSTPLYTKKIEKEIEKLDLTFNYFEKESNNKNLKKYIDKLQNEIDEYIIEFSKEDKIILFGKVFNKGYVLITQNIKEYKKTLEKVDSFFLLVTLFFLISISFFIYIFTLRKSMIQLSDDLKREYEELSIETKKVAFEDTLTKAASRLKFDETLKDLIQIASRFDEQKFSVIMMDIDNFKKINDTFGHDYGDIVLKEVANITKENLRNSDTFARWGGEEFIILSAFLDIEHAHKLAEKLRIIIKQIEFEKIDYITCSFGVVEFKKDDTEKSIIKRADELLYKAKENGKNRVEY